MYKFYTIPKLKWQRFFKLAASKYCNKCCDTWIKYCKCCLKSVKHSIVGKWVVCLITICTHVRIMVMTLDSSVDVHDT